MPKAGYAYARYSLNRGAPVQLVRQTLRHTSFTSPAAMPAPSKRLGSSGKKGEAGKEGDRE
ncbi:hypothetical protein [Nostoc sp.]|uniref:hypothetical protein n=1 Tax=Nostoc sp. TaxID=1180 RepID=UPI002FF93AB5